MIRLNGEVFADDLTSTADTTFSYAIVKRLVKDAGLTLKKVVQILNKDNAEKTTTQNLSNKLSRDTLKLLEFCRIASACGYDISIHKKGMPPEGKVDFRPDTTPTPDIPKRALTNGFKSLMLQGYTDYPSKNFEAVIIAGAKAQEAAEFIINNLYDGMDETQEVLLMIAANRHYKVLCQPITNDGRTFRMM